MPIRQNQHRCCVKCGKLFLFACATYFYLTGATAHCETLNVAVASNFYPTLARIKHQFEQTAEHRIVISRGSSGKLYAQIIHGAPYDMFLSADIKRPLLLERDGLIVAQSRSPYAIGRLALWSRNPKGDALKTLKQINFSKLALANPRSAPYGQAAMEVLRYLHLDFEIRDKLVYGENVAQAFQFVQSGAADMGLVSFSLIKPFAGDFWLAPPESYSTLEQQLVILKRSKKKDLAKLFADYLRRKEARQLIQQSGYIAP